MIRDDTLNIVILLMNLLLAGLCFAVARGERPAPALRFWAWGLLLYTFGLLAVLSARLLLPSPLAYFLGNVLITLAPLVSVRALLWHGATPFDPRRAWVVALPVIAVLAWNNFIGEFRPLLNFVPPTLVAIAAFGFVALRLFANPPSEIRASVRLLAVVGLVAAALWSARLLFLTKLIPLEVPDLAIANIALAIGQLMVTVAGTFALLAVEVRSMEQELKSQARRDALTGLPNRRAVDERFEQEIARAARERAPFGLLLLDIDHFKRINDVHGHPAGDAMLRCIAATLAKSKRTEDLLARVGGEEFLLLFVGANAASAQSLSQRLSEAVEEVGFEFEGQSLSVTISGGLVLYPDDGSTWQALYGTADQRLYRAKHRGRNQICGPWNAE